MAHRRAKTQSLIFADIDTQAKLGDLPDQHVHAFVDVHLLKVLRVRLDPHEEAAEGRGHRRLLDAPRVVVLLLEHLAVHDVLERVGEGFFTGLFGCGHGRWMRSANGVLDGGG